MERGRGGEGQGRTWDENGREATYKVPPYTPKQPHSPPNPPSTAEYPPAPAAPSQAAYYPHPS